MSFEHDASPLARALAERGYSELTPVQSAVLADEAQTRDLLVSAQTGSGKTVAYGLSIGRTLLGETGRLDAPGAPLALVIAPTRELALQVERELAWLFAQAGGRIVACVGGMDPRAERRRLEQGAHVVVGTPGRLRDHIDRRALDLSQLQAAALDEADEMLDLGFREDLEYILEAAPETRRTLLFSATLPSAIVAIARRFQRDPLRIEVASETRGHADIEHRGIRVHPREIPDVVVNVLRQHDAPAALVFCSTREGVRRMHEALASRGFSAVLMSGELGQAERNRALQELREGRARVCVATDVAARGIDLPNLDLVIHADLPNDAETLQHRSGRTGRAGRKGVSVLMVSNSRRRKAEMMLGQAGAVATWGPPPSAREIAELDQQRMFEDEAINAPATDHELTLARSLLERLSAEQVAVALRRLHEARLPRPSEVGDPGERFPARADSRVDGRTERFQRSERPERTEKYSPLDRPARSDEPAPYSKRAPFGDSVTFKLAVGRSRNADPKWLLPMICRRGGVTRQEIGAIKIFDQETRVEIAAHAADAFAMLALKQEKGDVAITRAEGAAEPARSNPGEARKPRPSNERQPERTPRPKGPRPPHKGARPKPAREADATKRPEGRPKARAWR